MRTCMRLDLFSAKSLGMRDPGPMARFEALKGDPLAAEEVFMRLTDEEGAQTLDEIAKAWGLPRGKFVQWYTEEHGERYDAALRVLGVALGHRVLRLVEGASRETVGLLKFQTDRYLRLAAHWDAQRYSPKVEHEHRGLPPVFNVVLLAQPSGGGVVEARREIDVTPAAVVEQEPELI